MATQVEPEELDLRAQMASIDEALANAARHRAEIDQRAIETKLEFPKFLVGSIIAAMGAGAAIGGLLVSQLGG